MFGIILEQKNLSSSVITQECFTCNIFVVILGWGALVIYRAKINLLNTQSIRTTVIVLFQHLQSCDEVV